MKSIESSRRKCPSPELREQYVRGADEATSREMERHALTCKDCQVDLVALGLALRPVTPDEERLLGELLASPLPPFTLPRASPEAAPAWSRAVELCTRWLSSHARPVAVAASVAVTLAVALPLSVRIILDRQKDSAVAHANQALAALTIDGRHMEARTSIYDEWSPYQPTRGAAEAPPSFDAAIGVLLQPRIEHPDDTSTAPQLATFYMWRNEAGDLKRARAELDKMPAGPAQRTDEASWYLRKGEPLSAIAVLRTALKENPGYLPALFDLAVAETRAEHVNEAIAAWSDYIKAAGNREARWVAEASGRLQQLQAATSRSGEAAPAPAAPWR